MSEVTVDIKFIFSKKVQLDQDFFKKFVKAYDGEELIDDPDGIILNNFKDVAKIEGRLITATIKGDGYPATLEECGFDRALNIAMAYPEMKIGFTIQITSFGECDSVQHDFYSYLCHDKDCEFINSDHYNEQLDYERDDFEIFGFKSKLPSLD